MKKIFAATLSLVCLLTACSQSCSQPAPQARHMGAVGRVVPDWSVRKWFVVSGAKARKLRGLARSLDALYVDGEARSHGQLHYASPTPCDAPDTWAFPVDRLLLAEYARCQVDAGAVKHCPVLASLPAPVADVSSCVIFATGEFAWDAGSDMLPPDDLDGGAL